MYIQVQEVIVYHICVRKVMLVGSILGMAACHATLGAAFYFIEAAEAERPNSCPNCTQTGRWQAKQLPQLYPDRYRWRAKQLPQLYPDR